MSDFHEPWTFGPSANGIQAKYDWAIADANGSKVCDSNDQLIPIDEHQARRIVAAVNAVANIPTHVLEAVNQSTGSLTKAIQEHVCIEHLQEQLSLRKRP
jgi:hypothetical protein